MGCANSRSHSSEESAILKGEKSLLWKDFLFNSAITAFEHREYQDSLSNQQFKAALADFGADYSFLDSPDSGLYAFFYKFKEDDKFDARKLKLLAILIGKGNARDKANFLFDAFDVNANQELSQTELLEAFERLADIAIDYLVDLGEGLPEEGKLESDKIDAYKTRLVNRRDDQVSKIQSDICGDQEKVTRGEFQAKLASKGFSDLVTSQGLRAFIHGPFQAATNSLVPDRWIQTTQNTPLLTTVIGTHPKKGDNAENLPACWFQGECMNAGDAVKAFEAQWAIPENKKKIEAAIDTFTGNMLDLFEEHDVALPTTGEFARDTYIYPFVRTLKNVDFVNLKKHCVRGTRVWDTPAIIGKVSLREEIVSGWDPLKEWQVCQNIADQKAAKLGKKPKMIKMTIPGPMTTADTIAFGENDHGYKSEEEMPIKREVQEDIIPVLQHWIKELIKNGCKHIQIDEPVFARSAYIEAALDYGFDNLDKVMSVVDSDPDIREMAKDVIFSVHMCRGYPRCLDDEGYAHADAENYIKMAERVDQAKYINWVSLEDANNHNDFSQLLPHFKTKTLILGVLCNHKSATDDVDRIVSRIEAALEYLPMDRLVLAPDCGLGFLTEEMIRNKLIALNKAKEIVFANHSQ